MLGITQFNHPDIYNLFIIVKQYIYAFHCQKSRPQINVLLEKIHEGKHIENTIARKNNHMQKHEKKWSIVM